MRKRLFIIVLMAVLAAGVVGSIFLWVRTDGAPYANSTLQLDRERVNIKMNVEEKLRTGRDYTTNVVVTANKMPDGISTEVFVRSEHENVATAEVVAHKGKNSTVRITAVNGGETRIAVLSSGGQIETYIGVKIVVPARDMQVNVDSRFAVMKDTAGVSTLEIDPNDFDFSAVTGREPFNNTFTVNEHDIEYALASPSNFFRIRGNNLEVERNAPTGKVELLARLKDSPNMQSLPFDVWVFDQMSDVALRTNNRIVQPDVNGRTWASMVLNEHNPSAPKNYNSWIDYSMQIDNLHMGADYGHGTNYGYKISNAYTRFVDVPATNGTDFTLKANGVTDSERRTFVEVIVFPIVRLDAVRTLRFDGANHRHVQRRREIDIEVVNVFKSDNKLFVEGDTNATTNGLTLLFAPNTEANRKEFRLKFDREKERPVNNTDRTRNPNTPFNLNANVTFEIGGLPDTDHVLYGRNITELFHLYFNNGTRWVQITQAMLDANGIPYYHDLQMILRDDSIVDDVWGISPETGKVNLGQYLLGLDFSVVQLQLIVKSVDQRSWITNHESIMFPIAEINITLFRAITDLRILNDKGEKTSVEYKNANGEVYARTGKLYPVIEGFINNGAYIFDIDVDAHMGTLTEREKTNGFAPRWAAGAMCVDSEHANQGNHSHLFELSAPITDPNSLNPKVVRYSLKILDHAHFLAEDYFPQNYILRFSHVSGISIDLTIDPMRLVDEMEPMEIASLEGGLVYTEGLRYSAYGYKDVSDGLPAVNSHFTTAAVRIGRNATEGSYAMSVTPIANSASIWITIEDIIGDTAGVVLSTDRKSFSAQAEGEYTIFYKLNAQNDGVLGMNYRNVDLSLKLYEMTLYIINPLIGVVFSDNYVDLKSRDSLYSSSPNYWNPASYVDLTLSFVYFRPRTTEMHPSMNLDIAFASTEATMYDLATRDPLDPTKTLNSPTNPNRDRFQLEIEEKDTKVSSATYQVRGRSETVGYVPLTFTVTHSIDGLFALSPRVLEFMVSVEEAIAVKSIDLFGIEHSPNPSTNSVLNIDARNTEEGISGRYNLAPRANPTFAYDRRFGYTFVVTGDGSQDVTIERVYERQRKYSTDSNVYNDVLCKCLDADEDGVRDDPDATCDACYIVYVRKPCVCGIAGCSNGLLVSVTSTGVLQTGIHETAMSELQIVLYVFTFDSVRNGNSPHSATPYFDGVNCRPVTVTIFDNTNTFIISKTQDFLNAFYHPNGGYDGEGRAIYHRCTADRVGCRIISGACTYGPIIQGRDFEDPKENQGGYYRITNDIDLTGYLLTPIRNFNGILSGISLSALGAGFGVNQTQFALRNFSMVEDNEYVNRFDNNNTTLNNISTAFVEDLAGVKTYNYGMFHNLRGTVMALTFSGAEVEMRRSPAGVATNSTINIGVVASIVDGGIIRDVTVELTRRNGGRYVHQVACAVNFGTIAAINEGTIREVNRLYATGIMTIDVAGVQSTGFAINVGGLVGVNFGTLTNDTANGANKIFEGDIAITSDVILAILGNTAQDGYAKTMDRNMGGIAGRNDGVINNLSTTSVLYNTLRGNTGGIVGLNTYNVESSYTNSNIYSRGVIGGIVGLNLSGTVQTCYYDFFINKRIEEGINQLRGRGGLYPKVRGKEVYAGIIVEGDLGGNLSINLLDVAAQGDRYPTIVGGIAGVNRESAKLLSCYATSAFIDHYPLIGNPAGTQATAPYRVVDYVLDYSYEGDIYIHNAKNVVVGGMIGQQYSDTRASRNHLNIRDTFSQLIVAVSDGVKLNHRAGGIQGNFFATTDSTYLTPEVDFGNQFGDGNGPIYYNGTPIGEILVGGGIGFIRPNNDWVNLDLYTDYDGNSNLTSVYPGSHWSMLFVFPDRTDNTKPVQYWVPATARCGLFMTICDRPGCTHTPTTLCNTINQGHISGNVGTGYLTDMVVRIAGDLNQLRDRDYFKNITKPQRINFLFREVDDTASGITYLTNASATTLGLNMTVNEATKPTGTVQTVNGVDYFWEHIPGNPHALPTPIADSGRWSTYEKLPEQLSFTTTSRNVYVDGQRTIMNKGYRSIYTNNGFLGNNQGGINYVVPAKENKGNYFHAVLEDRYKGNPPQGFTEGQFIGYNNDKGKNFMPSAALFYTQGQLISGRYEVANRYYLEDIFQDNIVVTESMANMYRVVHVIPNNASGRVQYSLRNAAGVANIGIDSSRGYPAWYIQVLGEGSFELQARSTRAVHPEDMAIGFVRFDVVRGITTQTVTTTEGFGRVGFESLIAGQACKTFACGSNCTKNHKRDFAVRKNTRMWVNPYTDDATIGNNGWVIQEQRKNYYEDGTDYTLPLWDITKSRGARETRYGKPCAEHHIFNPNCHNHIDEDTGAITKIGCTGVESGIKKIEYSFMPYITRTATVEFSLYTEIAIKPIGTTDVMRIEWNDVWYTPCETHTDKDENCQDCLDYASRIQTLPYTYEATELAIDLTAHFHGGATELTLEQGQVKIDATSSAVFTGAVVTDETFPDNSTLNSLLTFSYSYANVGVSSEKQTFPLFNSNGTRQANPNNFREQLIGDKYEWRTNVKGESGRDDMWNLEFALQMKLDDTYRELGLKRYEYTITLNVVPKEYKWANIGSDMRFDAPLAEGFFGELTVSQGQSLNDILKAFDEHPDGPIRYNTKRLSKSTPIQVYPQEAQAVNFQHFSETSSVVNTAALNTETFIVDVDAQFQNFNLYSNTTSGGFLRIAVSPAPATIRNVYLKSDTRYTDNGEPIYIRFRQLLHIGGNRYVRAPESGDRCLPYSTRSGAGTAADPHKFGWDGSFYFETRVIGPANNAIPAGLEFEVNVKLEVIHIERLANGDIRYKYPANHPTMAGQPMYKTICNGNCIRVDGTGTFCNAEHNNTVDSLRLRVLRRNGISIDIGGSNGRDPFFPVGMPTSIKTPFEGEDTKIIGRSAAVHGLPLISVPGTVLDTATVSSWLQPVGLPDGVEPGPRHENWRFNIPDQILNGILPNSEGLYQKLVGRSIVVTFEVEIVEANVIKFDAVQVMVPVVWFRVDGVRTSGNSNIILTNTSPRRDMRLILDETSYRGANQDLVTVINAERQNFINAINNDTRELLTWRGVGNRNSNYEMNMGTVESGAHRNLAKEGEPARWECSYFIYSDNPNCEGCKMAGVREYYENQNIRDVRRNPQWRDDINFVMGRNVATDGNNLKFIERVANAMRNPSLLNVKVNYVLNSKGSFDLVKEGSTSGITPYSVSNEWQITVSSGGEGDGWPPVEWDGTPDGKGGGGNGGGDGTGKDPAARMNPNTHYIMYRDIVMDGRKPIPFEGASLDGNNKRIFLVNFDLSDKPRNIGIWSIIPQGVVVKNLTIVLVPSRSGNATLATEFSGVKVDLTSAGWNYPSSSTVNIGTLAGVNNGIVTNVQVVPWWYYGNSQSNCVGNAVNGECVHTYCSTATGVRTCTDPCAKCAGRDHCHGVADFHRIPNTATQGRLAQTYTQANMGSGSTIRPGHAKLNVMVDNPTITVNVGGLVGINEGGASETANRGVITNSRVVLDIEVGGHPESKPDDANPTGVPENARMVVVAGFAAINRGSIVSSFFANGNITNYCRTVGGTNPTSATNGNFTAGFIGINAGRGIIRGCYVNGNTYDERNDRTSQNVYLWGEMYSLNGNIAGFVYVNGLNGAQATPSLIEDCLTRVLMRGRAVRSGFVHDNQINGYVHKNFVDNHNDNRNGAGYQEYFSNLAGTNQSPNVTFLNNKFTSNVNPTQIPGRWDMITTAGTSNAIADQSRQPDFIDKFMGYSISKDYITRGGKNLPAGDNMWSMVYNIGPRLVGASEIAVSIYLDMGHHPVTKTDDPVPHALYMPGKRTETAYNPHVITNGWQFNNIIYSGHTLAWSQFDQWQENRTPINYSDNEFNQHIRLVNNISLAESGLRGQVLNTYQVIFGTTATVSNSLERVSFDGNGLEIRDIAINAAPGLDPRRVASDPHACEDHYGIDCTHLHSVGLFSKMENAVVKNIRLSYARYAQEYYGINGTEATYAGGLAGIAKRSKIVDVEITTQSPTTTNLWHAFVVGSNVTGGLIGWATDNTIIDSVRGDITSMSFTGYTDQIRPSTSRAQFEGQDGWGNFHTYFAAANHPNISVAGGLVGIVDQGTAVSNTSNRQGSSFGASAEFVGGIIGVLGKPTSAQNALGLAGAGVRNVNYVGAGSNAGSDTRRLTSKYYAGGLVGVNFGVINNQELTNENTFTLSGTLSLAPQSSSTTSASAYVVRGGNSPNDTWYHGLYVGGVAGVNAGLIEGVLVRPTINNANAFAVGGIAGRIIDPKDTNFANYDTAGQSGMIRKYRIDGGNLNSSSGLYTGGIVGEYSGGSENEAETIGAKIFEIEEFNSGKNYYDNDTDPTKAPQIGNPFNSLPFGTGTGQSQLGGKGNTVPWLSIRYEYTIYTFQYHLIGMQARVVGVKTWTFTPVLSGTNGNQVTPYVPCGCTPTNCTSTTIVHGCPNTSKYNDGWLHSETAGNMDKTIWVKPVTTEPQSSWTTQWGNPTLSSMRVENYYALEYTPTPVIPQRTYAFGTFDSETGGFSRDESIVVGAAFTISSSSTINQIFINATALDFGGNMSPYFQPVNGARIISGTTGRNNFANNYVGNMALPSGFGNMSVGSVAIIPHDTANRLHLYLKTIA